MSRWTKTNALVQGRNHPPKIFSIHVILPALWCHSKFLPHSSSISPHMTPLPQRDYIIPNTSVCIIFHLMDMLLFSQSCLGFFSQSNNRIKDPYFSSLEHKVSYLNQHLNSYFPFSIASKELGIIWITYNSHESNYGFVPE